MYNVVETRARQNLVKEDQAKVKKVITEKFIIFFFFLAKKIHNIFTIIV